MVTTDELLRELRAIRALLEGGASCRLSRPDQRDRDAADTRLLAALAGAFGSAVFSAADLVRHARHDVAVQQALAGASARRVGKWLRRLATVPAHGGPYRVRRIGRDGAGLLWSVDVSDDQHTVRRPAPDRRAKLGHELPR